MIGGAVSFLVDNPVRVLSDIGGHLALSGVAVVIAIVIAVPLGALIGHTRRFSLVTINGANVLRSLPTLAIIAIGIGLYGIGYVNILVALVILAVPVILTNTYVGVAEVEPGQVEAARGMGMTAGEILRYVELPHAVPLIMAGVRTAAVFVVASAYLAGTAGYPHTLGSVITNPTLPVSQLLAYTVLAVVLSFAVDGVLTVVQRLVTPTGLTLTPTSHS